MLYYYGIHVSEGIYVIQPRESKECDVCHYWYFLDKGIKFQLDVSNGRHDVLMMSINLSNIDIASIHGADYNISLYPKH